jgi:hypothetical protein
LLWNIGEWASGQAADYFWSGGNNGPELDETQAWDWRLAELDDSQPLLLEWFLDWGANPSSVLGPMTVAQRRAHRHNKALRKLRGGNDGPRITPMHCPSAEVRDLPPALRDMFVRPRLLDEKPWTDSNGNDHFGPGEPLALANDTVGAYVEAFWDSGPFVTTLSNAFFSTVLAANASAFEVSLQTDLLQSALQAQTNTGVNVPVAMYHLVLPVTPAQHGGSTTTRVLYDWGLTVSPWDTLQITSTEGSIAGLKQVNDDNRALHVKVASLEAMVRDALRNRVADAIPPPRRQRARVEELSDEDWEETKRNEDGKRRVGSIGAGSKKGDGPYRGGPNRGQFESMERSGQLTACIYCKKNPPDHLGRECDAKPKGNRKYPRQDERMNAFWRAVDPKDEIAKAYAEAKTPGPIPESQPPSISSHKK